MVAIFNLAFLDSATLVFPLKLTHTCQDWFPPFAQKRLHSHFPPNHWHKKTSLIHSDSTWWWQSSWILPCWIQTLPSWIQTPSYLLSDSLKNILSPLWLLTQTNSIWLKLIHSHSTWWWQSSWILPCWIKKTSLIHSDSTWWWQSSWILPCWIQTPCFLLSDSLKNTLTPLWLWLKLVQSDSNLFILTQLDDGSHLEFGHLGFSHLSFPLKLTHTCQDWFPPFAQKNFHSFILTQLDDGSHLEFYHVGFRHCHLGFRHLLIFSQIHSKTLSHHCDSDSN